MSFQNVSILLISQTFSQKKIKNKRGGEAIISEISYPSLYQTVIEAKFTLVDGRKYSDEKT